MCVCVCVCGSRHSAAGIQPQAQSVKVPRSAGVYAPPQAQSVKVPRCAGVYAPPQAQGAKVPRCAWGTRRWDTDFYLSKEWEISPTDSSKGSSTTGSAFCGSLLTLSYTVLNYLAKTSNNWNQSVILVNTAAINSLSIGCVCVCVRACGSRLRARRCQDVRGWSQIGSGKRFPVARSRIDSMQYVCHERWCRSVWMVSLVLFGVAGVIWCRWCRLVSLVPFSFIWFHLVSSGVTANLICGICR